jgi:tRNA(Arg) A34 adenosine deaminase TadA
MLTVPRRRLLRMLPALGLLLASVARADRSAGEVRWYEVALQMKRRAEGRGDQPYGAVVVLDGVLVGEGESRVVQLGDPAAHAERLAIRDAQRRLKRRSLHGAVLYSTSRACAACEAAAADADVARMVYGERLQDAGAPRAAVEQR